MRRRRFGSLIRAVLSVGLASSALLAASEACAQDSTFVLDRLRIGGAPEDGIGVWRPDLAKKPTFYGQLALGLSWNPFRIENEIDDADQRRQVATVSGAPVREQFNGYFDIGFEVFERLGIQVMFPATFVQTGNDTAVAGVPAAHDSVDLAVAAAGDMRFEARGVIIKTKDNFFKLGANANIFAPSGNEFSYTGSRDVHGGVGLAAELSWKFLILTLDTGFHFQPPGTVNDFDQGHEWNFGLGGFVPLRNKSIRLGLEIFGSMQMSQDVATVATTPLEWMLEGRFALDKKQHLWLTGFGGTRLTPGYAPDFRVGAAFGGWFNIGDEEPKAPVKEPKLERYDGLVDTDKDGIPDNMDLCPTIPEDGKPPFKDDGCPAEPDDDNDGIPNSRDKCPKEPEDFDHVDDKDGCPEDDADADGVPDAQDKCPKEPGEKSNNGCPKFIKRVEGGTEIQILKKVEFEFGKATLRPDSFPILDEIYKLLVANPEITLLSIEGHTDDVGSDQTNLLLSKSRAKSCLDYLVKKGIPDSRLVSKGYGMSQPLVPNNSPTNKALNRRVQFIRTEAK